MEEGASLALLARSSNGDEAAKEEDGLGDGGIGDGREIAGLVFFVFFFFFLTCSFFVEALITISATEVMHSAESSQGWVQYLTVFSFRSAPTKTRSRHGEEERIVQNDANRVYNTYFIRTFCTHTRTIYTIHISYQYHLQSTESNRMHIHAHIYIYIHKPYPYMHRLIYHNTFGHFPCSIQRFGSIDKQKPVKDE
jgi:hypothetical protein